ncbi:succinate--CoA ligase subunit beta [Desulforamulus ruminis]|uniref:Succinate--CoA ligase (ADP-forming) n=1 Tax=Desulforamulus ruminis (strain ATCC 23193 / DSM 2154 / NCIMB 8452 / DL) TaxID=696281 RepID=F6DQN9_DESRL|nr:ATP-grasp domain-containing protein [Desulforamulus ruminis]AEG62036.1 Succinate--CoA ligase (ADP-forming) [Desulforamulus ruminis DSM 2154]
MKLFEYQAKMLFQEQGIAVPAGRIMDDLNQLEETVSSIGFPCVLKAQVLQGGRGKAGLIAKVASMEEARTQAQRIFDLTSRKVLVESAVEFDHEIYLSITVDPVSGSAMIMACLEGGVEIEEIARTSPEKIVVEYVDLAVGLMTYQAYNLVYALGLQGEQAKQGCQLLMKLYEVFQKYETDLVEINPLMITREGRLIAADGKVSLDDNALFRQGRFQITREYFNNDLEYEAAREGIPYIQFDGDIGLMCAGAGLTNIIFDLIHYAGGTVANYLEFGGPNYRKAHQCMEMMLSSNPKVILISTFGTIARADVMAQGIVEAVKDLKPTIPIITAIRGTGEEEAMALLKSVGLEPLNDTEEAVKRAVEFAGGGSK